MKIEMQGISKSFSSVKVLQNVNFTLEDSEIHALMGENGAGKSTLMKILTGVYSKDEGTVLVDGVPVEFTHPKQAEKQGIVFIYQELNTLKDLTVEANMFIGHEIHKSFGVLDKNAMRKKAEEAMKTLGVDIDVRRVMSSLSVGQQQMVEIAKALLGDVKTIIMDEPTAALTISETETLFRVIRQLKEKGVSIIYISHRMEEIFEICDRITVLRDGQYVGTKQLAETDMNDIVKMMIGRDIGERYPNRDCEKGDVVLEVEGLTKKGMFNDVSFSVRAGEVLGVSGLMGAGRTEIMKTVFGAIQPDGGTIKIRGKKVSIRSPLQGKKHKIGYITEDRKIEGLMLDKSISENIALINLSRISAKNVVVEPGKVKDLAQRGMEELSIRASGIHQLCRTLSGGNQQKTVFAQWVFTEPDILILDEPTRGVDVGAKKEIYTIINKLAAQGVAIIMISSELPEVLGMSDRIMAIHEGKVGGIIDGDGATQEKVMILATGGTLS